MRFDPDSLILLNAILALMMFGVALSLRPADFTRVIKMPMAPAAGWSRSSCCCRRPPAG